MTEFHGSEGGLHENAWIHPEIPCTCWDWHFFLWITAPQRMKKYSWQLLCCKLEAMLESRPLVSLLKDAEQNAVCGYYTVSSTRTVLNIWGLLWHPKVNLAAKYGFGAPQIGAPMPKREGWSGITLKASDVCFPQPSTSSCGFNHLGGVFPD